MIRYRLRTLLIVLALGPPVLAGCQVQEGGADFGGSAPSDAIYYDPGPEFRAARDAAKDREQSDP